MDLLWRISSGFLAGLGVLGLLKGIIDIQEDVQYVLAAFQAVTHPIWQFTIGQFIDLSPNAKDYLTLGVIHVGAEIRTFGLFSMSVLSSHSLVNQRSIRLPSHRLFLIFKLSNIFVWPFYYVAWFDLWRMKMHADRTYDNGYRIIQPYRLKIFSERLQLAGVYFQFILWALILITLNYALFLKP